MDDSISRQAAIDAFLPYAEYESNRSNKDWVKRIVTVLNDLPSVQPERKKGKWIRSGEDGYCSLCREDMPMFRMDWDRFEYCETPFCPNCGEQMEEGEVTV